MEFRSTIKHHMKSKSQVCLLSFDVDSEGVIIHIEERSPSCKFHFKTRQD